MRFQNGDAQPEAPPVKITLKPSSGNALNLYFDETLVGFFEHGKIYTVPFVEDNGGKKVLEEKGVQFVLCQTTASYRIEIEL